MKCPCCSAAISPRARFCPHCGEPLAAPPNPQIPQVLHVNVPVYMPRERRWSPGVAAWDRSPKRSQFRSGSRQRGGLPDSVRCDRRAHPHHSARGETRGESSGSGWSVFELGVDGPARRWTLLSPAFWSGPPPIPRHGPPRATNRMTRPPRRSLPQEAARGFWIRAWGQREPALQGTGRFNRPAPRLGALKSGLDIPATHVGYRSLRIENPNRTLTRRVRTRAEQAGMRLSVHIALSS